MNEYRDYMLDPLGSNSMKSANPHSGVHEIGVCPCLDTSTQNPCKNQGCGVVVLALDARAWKIHKDDPYGKKGGNGLGIGDDGSMYTLNTVDRHIVAILGKETNT